MSDEALFDAAQAGVYGAFEQIAQRYHRRIYRILVHMLKNTTDAEEVVQETFLTVFRKLHTFAQRSAPRTWLLRIAVNAGLMRLRAQRRKSWLSLEDQRATSAARRQARVWAENPWAQLPDDAMLSQELRAKLTQACAHLSEKYRLVLLLSDAQGHTNDEVAQMLRLTLPTVKARLHRARLLVRAHLNDYFYQC